MKEQQEPASGCSMPVPLWQAVGRKAKVGSLLLTLALAVAVFAMMRWLWEDTSGDAAYLAGAAAAATLLLTSVLAERSLLRGGRGCKHAPTKYRLAPYCKMKSISSSGLSHLKP